MHWGYFDAALKPLVTINSGDTVTISTVSGMAGQIMISDTGHGYLVAADLNGDMVADFGILVHSQTALVAADFNW